MEKLEFFKMLSQMNLEDEVAEENNTKELEKYTKVLYNQARLLSGFSSYFIIFMLVSFYI